MSYKDTIERVAVTDSATIIADKTRFMSGEVEYSLYMIDEAWDFREEALEEFCRRNVNDGMSETIDEKEIDKKFEEAAQGCEYERYELVDYTDIYTEEEGIFTVNNVSREGKIFVPKECTDNNLINALKADGFFLKEAANRTIHVTGDDMLVEFEMDDGYPICRLEKEDPVICPQKEKEHKPKQR